MLPRTDPVLRLGSKSDFNGRQHVWSLNCRSATEQTFYCLRQTVFVPWQKYSRITSSDIDISAQFLSPDVPLNVSRTNNFPQVFLFISNDACSFPPGSAALAQQGWRSKTGDQGWRSSAYAMRHRAAWPARRGAQAKAKPLQGAALLRPMVRAASPFMGDCPCVCLIAEKRKRGMFWPQGLVFPVK